MARRKPERGFSMAMDSLAPTHHNSIVVLTRDRNEVVRGFLHFVPVYGRPVCRCPSCATIAVLPTGSPNSWSFDRSTFCRARGIDELSLNFAAFAQLLQRPGGLLDRVLGHVVSLGNSFFQIESLYRFNAKFAPRWEPRYLVYEGTLALARTGLAAMRAEGQLRRGFP